MARLHEYQGKAILAANGFKIPRGRAASTADEAVIAAKEITDKADAEVVIKIQAWTTGRAGIGGVAFAKKPDEVRAHAARMLAMNVGQFPVEAVLVEEKIAIAREFFLSFAINDATRAPMIIFAAGGGSGIEERADETRRIACDVKRGPLDADVRAATASCGLSSEHAAQLAESIQKLFAAARSVEARSLEINPLVLTKDGEFVAADCRLTIDDYAVARHPELKIEIAREFDHPPTALERGAYNAALDSIARDLDLTTPEALCNELSEAGVKIAEPAVHLPLVRFHAVRRSPRLDMPLGGRLAGRPRVRHQRRPDLSARRYVPLRDGDLPGGAQSTASFLHC